MEREEGEMQYVDGREEREMEDGDKKGGKRDPDGD